MMTFTVTFYLLLRDLDPRSCTHRCSSQGGHLHRQLGPHRRRQDHGGAGEAVQGGHHQRHHQGVYSIMDMMMMVVFN